MTVQELLDALLALPMELRDARLRTQALTCGFSGEVEAGEDEWGKWVSIE